MSGRIADHLSEKDKDDIILYRNGPAGKEGVIKHQQRVIRLAFGGRYGRSCGQKADYPGIHGKAGC